MSVPKPPIVRLGDLKPKERGTFFCMLAEKIKGHTRSGKLFYNCRFRDARRTVSVMVWDDGPLYDSCDSAWAVGQFFKINGVFTIDPRYGLQVDPLKLRPVEDRDAADGFDASEYVDRSRPDPAALLADLRMRVEATIVDEPLRVLTLGLLDAHGEKLKMLPAHPQRFHQFPGGWVQHVHSVFATAVWLADHYREEFPGAAGHVNRDVVAASAVLHDIGRAVELDPGAGPFDPPEPTIDGRLFGHLFLGRDLVREAARTQGNVDPELLRLVEHVIVSHLNHPEWGSPKLPLIPEALILHHADDLDAKMEMFTRCLSRDNASGPFTERDQYLGRQLYKRREEAK